MTSILLKAAAFVLVIILGYGLKRAGLFGEGATDTVTKIMLNTARALRHFFIEILIYRDRLLRF